MLHRFEQDISSIIFPEKFTYPLNYQPHKLCMLANEQLQAYLASQTQWEDELSQGKMFGVLVVKDTSGNPGFIVAFSGNLEGKNSHPYFVPPVFDMLQPNNFFHTAVDEISTINKHIDLLVNDPYYLALQIQLKETIASTTQTLYKEKEKLKKQKVTRDEQRGKNTNAESISKLEHESRQQKGDFKRLKEMLKKNLELIQEEVNRHSCEIEHLKQKRKSQSAALQFKVFNNFRMLNIRGEEKSLCDIFAETVQKTPPAGAGECAAPKMLQYAFANKLQPLAMAEFWWGSSPKTEIRHHGHYYPACKGKCEPILEHMLDGMKVDENPLLHISHTNTYINIVYEDEFLLIVNKPAGLLSVPGRLGQECVLNYLSKQSANYQNLYAVHRLDMDTSGLLLLAKTAMIYKELQTMFKNRLIHKRYIAILSGHIKGNNGEIKLPLSPDYLNRPRQQVDYIHGKTTLTKWEVLEYTPYHTRVAFYPVTGRTHQLRIHSAHSNGLNCPIVGDKLYGTHGERLLLHAESLCFTHPISGLKVLVEQSAEF